MTALPTRQWEGQLLPPLPGLIGSPTSDDGTPGASGHNSGGRGPSERNPSAAHPAARLALLDRHGDAVYVTGRGLMSSPPETLRWGVRRLRITGWAGPWPVDEHWWAEGKRYARLQIAAREETHSGYHKGAPKDHAFLLVCKGKQWRIEATY